VLIVDDNGEIRALLARRLRRLGYSVGEAGDGVEALVQVEAAVPDVVVTDMAMPRLDGLGLLKELREKNPELPVIVLTGQGSLGNAIQAVREGGVFDYLLKPLADLALLDVAVRRALEVRQLRARSREADQVVAMREMAVTACDRILNPLNAIALALASLSGAGSTPESRARAASIIEQAIDQITKVVRQMHAVARYVPRDVAPGLREIDLEKSATGQQDSE